MPARTVLFHDHGLFTHYARTLSRYFDRVLYYCPWKSAFPTSNLLRVGDGFPEMERVRDFWTAVEEADLIVFADVYEADLQEHLRKIGKRVWGPGRGEDLELYRFETKQLQRELGMAVQPVRLIAGIEKLRAHLRGQENKFVKMSLTRGDMETWHWKNWELSRGELDNLAVSLGPVADAAEFVIEDSIEDAVEAGYDGFCVDGKFAATALLGYEIKDCGLLGAVRKYKDFPKQVREVNAKLAPVLKSYGYRGFWSTEIRVGKDKKPYLIDPCCRLGAPPSELYQELYDNWGDILWEGAAGNVVNPHPVAKYGVEAIIYSDYAQKHWQPVHYPKAVEQWVKLRNACRFPRVEAASRRLSSDKSRDGSSTILDYVAPQDYELKQIGAVVGIGDTILEAVEKCREVAEQVEGPGIKIRLDAIGDAIKTIQEAEDKGMEFSDEELPEPEQVMN